MAISPTAGVTASNGAAGTSLACPTVAVAAGQTVLVAVALRNTAATVASVTDAAGNTYSLLSGGAANNATNVRIEIWSCPNALANAANVVTVTLAAASLMSVLVEVYDGLSVGGMNSITRISWTCTVTSNNFGSGGLNPNGTVGNGTNIWITNHSPQNIIVDMKAAQTFNGLRITPNQSNAIGTAYTLDVSDDGATWTSTGETISGLQTATVAAQLWPLSTSYSHRYLRVNVTADNGNVSMANLEVGTIILPNTRLQNGGVAQGSTVNVQQVVSIAHAGDWSTCFWAIATSSGDTITAGSGTMRGFLIPALTTAGVALMDSNGSSSMVFSATLSAARSWVGVGVVLVTDGAPAGAVTGAKLMPPVPDAGRGANHQTVKAPPFAPSSGGGGNYGYSG